MSFPNNIPLYNLQGQRIATTYTDLWDGSIQNAIRYDEFGNSVSGPVWTGTSNNGFGRAGFQVSNANVIIGDPLVTSFLWVGFNPGYTRPSSELHSVYAVSGTLTVPIMSNLPPTADAGADQSLRAGDTVNLDGSGSSDDNTAPEALAYSWSFSLKPGGSMATLSGADTATPSFVADLAGSYVVELVVTDEGGLPSPPDSVIISSDNLAPS